MAWYEFGKSGGNSGRLANIDRDLAGAQQSLLDAIMSSRNLSQTGATDADFARVTDPLYGQIGRLDRAQGLLSGLPGELQSSAMASTASAGIAASNAARLSGGGRFGSGGNAAILASRGASNAAASQSAALSQALVQGRMADANYQAGILNQRSGVLGALSGYLQSQVGLKEERARIPMDLQTEMANLLLGSAGVHAGIATTRMAGRSQENAATIGGLFQVAASNKANTGR
jgi:hypothetical protein